MFHQAQRMIQHVVNTHGREGRAGRRGKPQHVRHNRVDALQLAPQRPR